MAEEFRVGTNGGARARSGAMCGLVLGASLYLVAHGAACYETPREESQSNYLGWAARVVRDHVLEAPGWWLLRQLYTEEQLGNMSLNRKLPARIGVGLLAAALAGAALGAGVGAAFRRWRPHEVGPVQGDACAWGTLAAALALASPVVFGHFTGFLAIVTGQIAVRRADADAKGLRRVARTAQGLGLAGQFLFCWVLAIDRAPGWSVEGAPGLLKYLPLPR